MTALLIAAFVVLLGLGLGLSSRPRRRPLRPPPSGRKVSEEVLNGKTGAAHWELAPRLWTLPWIGSFFSYTRDPCGFITSSHARLGDVFTTTILGYDCTFVRSQAHLSTFASSSRKVLDLTKAYKLVAAPLIGEEAFLGQTRHVYKALSHARVEKLGGRLWTFAGEALSASIEEATLEHGHGGTRVVDLSKVVEDVVFSMDAYVLCGARLARNHGRELGACFREMDGDLSLLGLLGAALSPNKRRARRDLFELVERDVDRRLEEGALADARRRIEGSWDEEEKEVVGSTTKEEEDEFAEYLLRKELDDAGQEVVDAAANGDPEARRVLGLRVHHVALVIYGLIWAAQTNAVSTTTWAVHDLLFHPEHIDALRDELSSARPTSTSLPPFADLPHLLACTNETLRTRVTGAWPRFASEPVFLAPSSAGQGLVCPPGFVVASPISIARDEQIYPEPETWDPSRYRRPPFASGDEGIKLDGFGSPPISVHQSLFGSWGLGHSQCPGRVLAYRMMATAISLLFERYNVALQPPSSSTTTTGKGRVPMPVKGNDIAAAGVQRFPRGYRLLAEVKPRRGDVAAADP